MINTLSILGDGSITGWQPDKIRSCDLKISNNLYLSFSYSVYHARFSVRLLVIGNNFKYDRHERMQGQLGKLASIDGINTTKSQYKYVMMGDEYLGNYLSQIGNNKILVESIENKNASEYAESQKNVAVIKSINDFTFHYKDMDGMKNPVIDYIARRDEQWVFEYSLESDEFYIGYIRNGKLLDVITWTPNE